ncbi:hypothetical protein [Novosphingobium sp.]|uniref:hypothetical protein n=1 Tax=Novosphingobium sp. TaxID=1874826 RepID=UPI0025D70BD1|nr:hypothetical protein [Novosphingobium sp.]
MQYDLKGGFTDGTTLRLGVRNITDSRPPIDLSSFAYMGSLDSEPTLLVHQYPQRFLSVLSPPSTWPVEGGG